VTIKYLLDLLRNLGRIRLSQRVRLELRAVPGLSPCLLCFCIVRKPFHREHLLETRPLGAVFFEQGSANGDGCLADLVPGTKRKVGRVLDGLASNLFVVLVVEGKHATQQQVRYHTKRPKVHLFAVRLLEQHLRGDIRQRAERVETCFGWPNNFGKSEVDDLEVSIVLVASHKDVLRFEVAVGDAVAMQIVDSGCELVSHLFSAFFRNDEFALFKISE
jgi:hypothetical protein